MISRYKSRHGAESRLAEQLPVQMSLGQQEPENRDGLDSCQVLGQYRHQVLVNEWLMGSRPGSLLLV